MSEEERAVEEREPKAVTDVQQELAELGRKLTAATKAAWQAEESVRFRQEVEEGLRKAAQELERGLETARAHPNTQRVKERVGETWESVRTAEATQNVKEKLLEALQSLNAELSDLLKDLSGSEPVEESDKGEE